MVQYVGSEVVRRTAGWDPVLELEGHTFNLETATVVSEKDSESAARLAVSGSEPQKKKRLMSILTSLSSYLDIAGWFQLLWSMITGMSAWSRYERVKGRLH